MMIERCNADIDSGTVETNRNIMAKLGNFPGISQLVYHGYGKFEGRQYVLMKSLGIDLTRMRRMEPDERMNVQCASKIGE